MIWSENERENIIQLRKHILDKIAATNNEKRKQWLYYECLEPLNQRLVQLNRRMAA